MRIPGAALGLALTLAAGCRSPAPATQVVVIVEADPLVEDETARLDWEVRGGAAEDDQLAVREMRTNEPAEFPFDVTIAPFGNDATRVFELEATALDRAGRIVARVRVRSAFAPGTSRTIRLRMDDRCRGIVCPTRQTCALGACVADGDPSDGGVDRPDGGTPGPCTADAECDDGTFCNGREICVEGACVPGDRPDCSDRFACTEDRCEVDGCVHVANDGLCTVASGGRCDPENGCQYDVCDERTCTAGPCETATCDGTTCRRRSDCREGQQCCGATCVAAGCDDANPCTADACDTTTAACVNTPRTFPCSDGDACTTGDACSGGACRGGGVLSCDDGRACTVDSCSPAIGCQHVDGSGGCDDGDACTVGDACGGGACIPGARMGCDDGIPCTIDSCGGGTCMHEGRDSLCPGIARCVAGMGCVFSGSCDAAACAASAPPCMTGTCSGSSCTYTSNCATGQLCCAGTCQTCEDGNPCTTDACSGTSCSHAPAGGACSDGDLCTTGDACSGTSCAGRPTPCNDGNPCTTDSCNPASGACQFVPVAAGTGCSDGDPCTTGDACNASGACTSSGTMFCNDLNVCTTDACQPGVGCVHTPRADGEPCGFGGGCAMEQCWGGECLGSGVSCGPGQRCCFGGCVPDEGPACLDGPMS